MSNAAQTAPAGPVLLESRHDSIAVLVMNRPDKLNALNSELSTALNEALARIAEDDSVHVVVLCGAGRAFCAGGTSAPSARDASATRLLSSARFCDPGCKPF